MKKRLIQFYNSFGDRGVMFILYALAVVANALPAIFAELPAVFPDEMNNAGAAAAFSGRSWQGVPEGSGSGYIQAVLYTPLFLVIKNPYALYKAMLIMNALIVAFIPLIAYHLAGKFGVVRVRRKLLVAFCCGLYVTYFTDSKFIWNETLACLMGWVLALCLFSSWERKSRSSRAALSVLVGFLCAAAYAVNTQLIGLVAALVLTVVLARIFMREKMLNLPMFGISFIASFIAEHFLRQAVADSLWGGTSQTVENVVSLQTGSGFFSVFFTQLYAFMTSSVGTGALAAAIFVVMMFSCLAEGIKDRPKTLEDGTKVYEPIKHKYSMRLTIFALFQFLAVICTAATAAFFTSSSTARAELAVFGQYTDNIAPLAIFLVLVYIFLYGIDLAKPIIGAGVYGYSCICFAAAGIPTAELSEQFKYSAFFGLFGMFGEDAAENAGMNCVIMSSLVFTLYALIIVFASCMRKHRTTAVTGTVFCVMMAATIYTGIVFLPSVFIRNSENKAPVRELMGFVYNDAQSPPIVVYNAKPEIAATLQFIAPETRVRSLQSSESVSDSCLLIAKTGVQPPFEGGSYDIVGRTSEYTVYAFGDIARDFIRFSALKDSENSTVSSSSH